MTPADLLAFERQWWQHAGRKEQAIRDRFRVSATRYYQALNSAINDPSALAIDAATVRRLQRARDRTQRQRARRLIG